MARSGVAPEAVRDGSVTTERLLRLGLDEGARQRRRRDDRGRVVAHHPPPQHQAAKSPKSHHWTAYAALRQVRPDGRGGGGTRARVPPVWSGASEVAKANAL